MDSKLVAQAKAKLAAVKNREGKEVKDEGVLDYVDFTARDRTYQIALHTGAYSLKEVISHRTAMEDLDSQEGTSEAFTLASDLLTRLNKIAPDDPSGIEGGVSDHRLRQIKTLAQKLCETIPSVEPDQFELVRMEKNARFLLIGAVAWNVPDIELTPEGLMDGDYRVVLAAIEAINTTLNPTSEAEGQTQNDGEANSQSSTATTETPAALTLAT